MQTSARDAFFADSAIHVPDWIRYHANHRPEKVALHSADDGRRVTYSTLDRRINALADWLRHECHVMAGDRVMHLSRTTIEAFEIQFACARLGAIFTPVNWRLSSIELMAIARDAEPKILIYQQEFKVTAQAIVEQCGCLAQSFENGATHSTYELMVAKAPERAIDVPRIDWESTWIILYTSGTTGQPKGAMLSHRMMYFNVLNFLPVTGISMDTVFLCCMPTFHTGGLNCYANPVLYCGGTVVVMGEFSPGRAIDLLVDPALGVSHFFGVPAIYLMMSEHESFKNAKFAALSNAGLGGAPATESLVAKWLEKGAPLQPAYGMTEIGPAIAVSNVANVRNKLRSVGHPVMNIELRIADASNREVAKGDVGELQVRGPVLMSGYWRKPEQTQASFVDGWFRTGDAARLDEDGCLYIVDRYKDMYISGGENVYPNEVENAIAKHPAVLRTAVIGVEDSKWGEVGKAFVVIKPGQTLDAQALDEHLKGHLASYKRPKFYQFLEDLPQTASGKVKKNDLRAGEAVIHHHQRPS